jgi:hypothetical protein
MKKFLFAFFVIVVAVVGEAKGGGSCAEKGRMQGYINGPYGCNCEKKNHTKVYNGTVVLTNFPNGRKCNTQGINHFEDETETLCAGWTIAEYNVSIHEPELSGETKGGCWKWKCKDGKVFMTGSHTTCISEDALAEQNSALATCYQEVAAGRKVMINNNTACIPYCNQSNSPFTGDGTYVSFGTQDTTETKTGK